MNQFNFETLKALSEDQEFQKRFASDPILDRLDFFMDEKRARLEILSVLGGVFAVGGVEFPPITAGKLSLLALLKSPFILGGVSEASLLDVDVAACLLFEGKTVLPALGNFEVFAAGYCDKIGISRTETAEAILEAVQISLSGFDMIPSSMDVSASNRCKWGADWITSIVSMISDVANYTPEQIIWDVPMTTISYLCAQYLRKNGMKGIRQRMSEDIRAEYFARVDELIIQRAKERGLDYVSRRNF